MATTDTLRKPDMPAVVQRTHISHDLHGLLLPVFEAISNSIHGIERRFPDSAATSGRIWIQFIRTGEPAKFRISVCDNGVGLDKENYDSFLTPFSGLKLAKRGRGFGRFIAFKVFKRILYSSNYGEDAAAASRTFRFNIYDDREVIYFDGTPDFKGPGVCVDYDELRDEWHAILAELSNDAVRDEIAQHFFPEFLRGSLPRILLKFGDQESDLTAQFSTLIQPHKTGRITVSLEGKNETLEYTLSRVRRTRKFTTNALLFSAGNRIVGKPRDLSQKLGRPFFVDDEDNKYIIIAVVSGEPLERRLNDARTSLDIAPKAVEDVVAAIATEIEAEESAQIEKIKEAQRKELADALTENPILRIGLGGQPLADYVKTKPNSWKAENFVSDLALKRFRASTDLTETIEKASADEKSYYQEIHEIVQKLDQGKRDALAEYVVHRKKVISLIESARKFGSDGKRAPEDTIHDLIFRRYTDNTSQSYFDHNLWLVDDALAFCPYIASDRTMHGGRRNAGDKVTDLLFYDDSLILGENDGTSLVIVEFKKPSRDDYRFGPSKTDPVMQVVETLEKATAAGGITKQDGQHFSFAEVSRRFAYVIADLTPTLVEVLKKHDFRNDWNPKVWFRYRDNEQIAIYVYGYDSMIENAKKRNAAFFSVLLGE